MTRLLVADDYEDIRTGLRLEFGREGYEVTEAADGREAIEAYRRSVSEGRPFAVCILDQMMPHYKGDVVAVRIREMAAAAKITPPYIALLTGSKDSALVSRTQAAGLSELFIKPDGWKDIMDRLAGRSVLTQAAR